MNRNRGITLIALVITVIVLLILAGVAIASLTGENGILNRSKQATYEYEWQQAREEIILAVNSAKMAQESPNGGSFRSVIGTELSKVENNTYSPSEQTQIDTADVITGTNKGIYGYTIDLDSGTITKESEENKEIADNPEDPTPPTPPAEKPGKPDDTTGIFTESSTIDGTQGGAYNPTIPKGFKPIDTDTSKWGDGANPPTQNDVNQGLVIQDKNGNEFVWIPVDENNPFERRNGYEDGSPQSNYSDYAEVDSKGNNSFFEENQEIKNEAIAMYASVSNNGGFYIGRYEAGIESATPREDGDTIEDDKLVVQKDKNVYNYVGWSDSIDRTDITGGAVELARGFANEQGYDTTKVHSTLCYSVQWDTALNFIDPGYTGYAKDSTGKGNHNESQNANSWRRDLTTTGASESYKVKNIYDMAGNVWEWTMESSLTHGRASRGGYYNRTGLNNPASFRIGGNSDNSLKYVSFRLSLYL